MPSVVLALIQTPNAPIRYLLARRLACQTFGGALELVGGKRALHEAPKSALAREIHEELGLEVGIHQMRFVACIDRMQVFDVVLDGTQIQMLGNASLTWCGVGRLGQRLHWCDDLGCVLSQMPPANSALRAFCTEPILYITPPINQDTPQALDVYRRYLPPGAFLYLRGQCIRAFAGLLSARGDLLTIATQEVADALKYTPHAIKIFEDGYAGYRGIPAPGRAIFASAHCLTSLQVLNAIARTHPITGAAISPILPTKTHPKVSALGWDILGQWAKVAPCRLYALGGMRSAHLASARAQGAFGIAGISLFYDIKQQF